MSSSATSQISNNLFTLRPTPSLHQQLVSSGFSIYTLLARHDLKTLHERHFKNWKNIRIIAATELRAWDDVDFRYLHDVHALYVPDQSLYDTEHSYTDQMHMLRQMDRINCMSVGITAHRYTKLLSEFTHHYIVPNHLLPLQLEKYKPQLRIFPIELLPRDVQKCGSHMLLYN